MIRHARLAALAAALHLAPAVQAGGMSNELLLASAWCSFSFNKTTGYSHTKRFQFAGNGTYGMNSGGEGYSSGGGGSMASQSQSRNGGMWKVHNGELYMSEGPGQLQPVNTYLKRSSNGSYVIVADGIEYTQCR